MLNEMFGRPGNGDPRIQTNQPKLRTFADDVKGSFKREIDLELAYLSRNVYLDDNRALGFSNWIPMTIGQLEDKGIDPALCVDAYSGFRAKFYCDQEDRYVLAFRGAITQVGTYNALSQVFGKDDVSQFNKATELAKIASQAFGEDIVFTGHSLGGALSVVAAFNSGSPAVVFAPASVHENMLKKVMPAPRDGEEFDVDALRQAVAGTELIRNYVVAGDYVNTFQEKGLMPEHWGTVIRLSDPNPLTTLQSYIPLMEAAHEFRTHLVDRTCDAMNVYFGLNKGRQSALEHVTELRRGGLLSHYTNPDNDIYQKIHDGIISSKVENIKRGTTGEIAAELTCMALERGIIPDRVWSNPEVGTIGIMAKGNNMGGLNVVEKKEWDLCPDMCLSTQRANELTLNRPADPNLRGDVEFVPLPRR